MHDVRVEDIAEAANVSTGLIYYHFKNRQELLRAGLTEALNNCMPYERPVGDLSPADRLYAALGQYLGTEAEAAKQDRIYAEGMRAAVFDPALRPALTSTIDRWESATAGLVEAAFPSGAAAEARPTAKALTALVDGLQQRVRSRLIPREQALELLRAAIDAAVEEVQNGDR